MNIILNKEYDLNIKKSDSSRIFNANYKYIIEMIFKNILGIELLKIKCNESDISIIVSNMEYSYYLKRNVALSINLFYLIEIYYNEEKLYMKISTMRDFNVDGVIHPIVNIDITDNILDIIESLYQVIS